MKLFFKFSFFFFLFVLSFTAQAKDVPYLSGRVVDLANMISENTENEMIQLLQNLEQKNGSQVAILTVESLDGEVLEQYSLKVAQTWGLGQKSKDNGLLFFVAKNDRKMRIEVGYGLESIVTDAMAAKILNNVVRPNFKKGDFSKGFLQATKILVDLIGGDSSSYQKISEKNNASIPGGIPFFAIIIFIFVIGTHSYVAFFSKSSSLFHAIFLMPFWFAFPSVFVHPSAGFFCLGFWIILYFFVRPFLKNKEWFVSLGKNIRYRSGSSGGGGFSGGGFSGGGGSFGGGGSSSSW